MMVDQDKEARLLEKIASGQKIESADEMTPEYREQLLNLLLMQADSELAGCFGYVPWIMKAPTLDEKVVVAQMVRDEVGHAQMVYRLLADLGVDVEGRISGHDLTYRTKGDEELGAKRAADDGRVNIFYYPIDTWADYIMFNFCMDRGAGHQLEDAMKGSYGPWARVMERIFREEMMHVKHGDLWVKRLAEDPATHDEVQAALDKWFLRTMNIFGRPGSRRNAIYRKYGLKQRDNDAVRQAFVADITPKVQEWGLRLPTWTPDWATP